MGEKKKCINKMKNIRTRSIKTYNKFVTNFQPNRKSSSFSAAIIYLSMAMPASADAGKIFDFNATFPEMIAQFLLLMGFLDKTWFGPVGKIMDEREEKIRASWNTMKNSNNDLESRQKEAEKMLQDARDKAKSTFADPNAERTEKKEPSLKAEKSKLDDELAREVSTIESETLTIQAELDSQVNELSQQIIKRVLPNGFSL